MFEFKIVKKSELRKLKSDVDEIVDIVSDRAIFTDANGRLQTDKHFQHQEVEKKWNNFYKLGFGAIDKLRELTK